jgi:mRNA interferase MazF
MNVRRGEVWLANFNPVAGHEQAGTRPALVLSVDAFNLTRAQLVTVIPITSKNMVGNPFRIEVCAGAGGLSIVSYIIGEQLRTIATSRLTARLGLVSAKTMARVEETTRTVLGL